MEHRKTHPPSSFGFWDNDRLGYYTAFDVHPTPNCLLSQRRLVRLVRCIINRYGELYVKRHPKLKINLVDGSGLTVAIVLHSIPKETTKVLIRGKLNKVAYAIVSALCQRDIKVVISSQNDYGKLQLTTNCHTNLVLSKNFTQKIWLVGDGVTEEDQQMASKGTTFIPFSQIPPKKAWKDCIYHLTPEMLAPDSLKNLDSCENWLPRRVLSAGWVAGILHALEGWNANECGDSIFNVEKVWEASLKHGFRPLAYSNSG